MISTICIYTVHTALTKSFVKISHRVYYTVIASLSCRSVHRSSVSKNVNPVFLFVTAHVLCLAHLHMQTLPLMVTVDVGRFQQNKLGERMCPHCKSDTIEDKLHFVFYYPLYAVLRTF